GLHSLVNIRFDVRQGCLCAGGCREFGCHEQCSIAMTKRSSRFQSLIATGLLLISGHPFLLWTVDAQQTLPLGNPHQLEHSTPTGTPEVSQRLIAFPFTPPDVKLKETEALSSSNDWFTKHDKNKIDELGSLDFYAATGPESVGVVPKLHNTSAGVEIYRLP